MYCRFVRKNSIVCYHFHIFFQHLLVDLDVILATDGNFLLGKWIREARKQGNNIKSWTHLTLPYRRERQKKAFSILVFYWDFDGLYIYLSLYSQHGLSLGVSKIKRFFFLFEWGFFSSAFCPCVFFCPPRPEKKHRMGKRGRASEIEFAKGKGRRKMTGGRAKLSCFSFTRPLVGTGSYWTPPFLRNNNPFRKFLETLSVLLFLPQQASGAGRATSTNSTREIRQLKIP